MQTIDWQTFLDHWSEHILSTPLQNAFPDDVVTSGWIGFPGALEDEIAQVESRLQTKLPPSYRQFLQVSNGWRMVFPLCGKILPISQVDWLNNRRPDLINAWQLGESLAGTGFSIPDDEYLNYGADQDPAWFRSEYMESALEVSDLDVREDAIYLLNPQVVTPEGEWEAWYFASWLPGAVRYRSFWELMQAEYARYLDSVRSQARYPDDFLNYVREQLAETHPEPALQDISELVASLQRKIDSLSTPIDKRSSKSTRLPGYVSQELGAFEFVLNKIVALQKTVSDSSQQVEALGSLVMELESQARKDRRAFMRSLDHKKVALAALQNEIMGDSASLDQLFQASGKSVGYMNAAETIRKFLKGDTLP